MEKRWRHKKFSLDDVRSILELRLKVFHEPSYDEARWTWQYQRNPQGKSYIDLAVDKENEKTLAGHYAVIGYKLRWNNDLVSSVQSLDTYTSPDYQRQGIFAELAEETFRSCKDDGVKMVFGFPNQNSYGGFVKKLGFSDPFALVVYRKPLRLGYYLDRFIGKSIFSGVKISLKSLTKELEVREVPSFDEKVEEVLRTFQQAFPFMVDRSIAYLNWRYSTCPDRKYKKYLLLKDSKVIGLFVLGIDLKNNYAHLVDFAFQQKDQFPCILKAATKTSIQFGMNCITYFTNEDSLLSDLLLEEGFRAKSNESPFRFILRDLSGKGLINEFSKQASHWLITAGDTDFY